MEPLDRYLKDVKFFSGLPQRYFDLMVGCASNVRFEKDQFIFRTGEQANQWYIIREGMVALEIPVQGNTPIILQTVGVEDVVGWSWLFPPYQWRFDTRAEISTRAIAIDGQCIRTKCDENPELGYELFKRLSMVVERRLQATRLQLLDIYTYSY